MDGEDRGRAEGESGRARDRGTAHLLEAYVLVEHAWMPVLRADDRHAKVLQDVESDRDRTEQAEWIII